MLVAQEEMRKMAVARDEAEQKSSSDKKQYEEQELVSYCGSFLAAGGIIIISL